MLAWLRRWLRLDPPVSMSKPAERRTTVEDIRDQIRQLVVQGFLDEDAILRDVAYYFGERDLVLVQREAPALLRQAMADRATAERSWPAQTDCDRLDAAFAALEADGVISRQNFNCCGTCGSTEIWEEIAEAQKSGLPARGYAFFHVQDTENAAEGGGLFLNYGACEEGEAAAVGVGRDIVAQLNAHGLQTDWDGTISKRIGIALDWKKRRMVRPTEVSLH